jgi:xanthine phosphoribosyltransferase
MHSLKKRILEEGRLIGDDILKVDSFLNHQIDPVLMEDIGAEFGRRYSGERITRVLTIETSGIAPALFAALALKVPVVFAKKAGARNQDTSCYQTSVHSFTRDKDYIIQVSRRYLDPLDRILLIDDFLANGQALIGLADIVAQAGATLVGAGIVIEKGFQDGGRLARSMGIRVESLAVIKKMSQGQITFDP